MSTVYEDAIIDVKFPTDEPPVIYADNTYHLHIEYRDDSSNSYVLNAHADFQKGDVISEDYLNEMFAYSLPENRTPSLHRLHISGPREGLIQPNYVNSPLYKVINNG